MLVRALHGGLSSDQERLDYLPIIWCGVLNGVQALIAAARAHGVPFDTAALSALADEIAAMHAFDTPLTAALCEKLIAVHECGAVQRVLAEHARDASLSSAHTTRRLMAHLDRLTVPDYVPSVNDILWSRLRTSGIVEVPVACDGFEVTLVDVGGPRSERKKWMHCFTGLAAVVFLVLFDAIGRGLYEDERRDAWEEQALLLSQVLSTKFWRDTPVILVTSHRDCLPATASPEHMALEMLQKAAGAPEVQQDMQQRTGAVWLIPDVTLIDCESDKARRQVATVLRLACEGAAVLPPQVIVEPVSVPHLTCDVRLFRHPSPNQWAMWTFVMIWRFRPESTPARLLKDLVKLIARMVIM